MAATPQSWAASVLRGLGIHQTPGAVQALVGWARAEGGHWNNDARFNPLNTTQPEPGAGNTGSQGNIKVYRSWDQGIRATVETLTNGRYGGILSALRGGDPARVADAIGRSPWGTSAATARSAILGTPRMSGARPLGGTSRGSSPGAQVLVDAGGGSSGGADLGPGADVSGAVAALLSSAQPAAAPVSAPAPTAHSARAVMPSGYAPPSSGGPAAAQAPDVSALLDAVRTQGGGLPAQGGQDAGGGVYTAPGATSGAHGGGRGGVVSFEGKPVAAWIAPILRYARERGWKGTVRSGVRTDAEQTAIYQRGTRPAALPKSMGGRGSMHEETGFLHGAVDVSDAATLDRILRAKHSRLKFAGARDPVHFSVPRGGSY